MKNPQTHPGSTFDSQSEIGGGGFQSINIDSNPAHSAGPSLCILHILYSLYTLHILLLLSNDKLKDSGTVLLMQTTIAATSGSTLAALAFAQGMFLNVLLIEDWQVITPTQEHHVNENL